MNDRSFAHRARSSLSDRPLAVALSPPDARRTAIKAATVGIVRAEHCDRIRHVRRILGAAGATMFIASARDADGVLVDALVEELRQQAPGLLIVVLVPHDADVDDFGQIARLGVAEVYQAGDPRLREQIAALVDRMSFRARLNELADLAAAQFPASVRSIIRHAIQRGDTPLEVPDFALELGMETRTLERRCARAGLVTPEVLIGFGRVNAATFRLDSSLAAIEAIALDLGFTSHSTFCRVFKRLARMKPGEARTVGARSVLKQFVAGRFGRA
jgi:AraC-like DNA-binding protein